MAAGWPRRGGCGWASESVDPRRRAILAHRVTPPPYPFLQFSGQLALVSPQALSQLFDGLAAGRRAWRLGVCMRVHHTPGSLPPPLLSSVLRWLLKLVPSQ